MKEINNIIICGLGAIGTTIGEKILLTSQNALKVLVDKTRLNKYLKNPRIINGNTLNFDYILPEEKNYKADLILIAVKSNGLKEVLENISNFVTEDTIIISLLNGVTSEEILAERYGWDKILPAYYIGSSAIRNGEKISHNGIATIVFGAKNKNQTEKVEKVKTFFKNNNIGYKISDNIERSLWTKFMLNVACNQLSAILGLTFKDMQEIKLFKHLAISVMKEVELCAKAYGINNTDTMMDEVFEHIKTITPEGKTSMLQDIEAGRKTEVDIFAGSVIEFGERFNIKTPYNRTLKRLINSLEQKALS